MAPSTAGGVEYLDAGPMTALVKAQRGPVQTGGAISVPVITWGGDVATIYGNGGATTQPGSAFAREGLSLKLFREDNFVSAVERVVTGETPYLRGTVDMVNSALPALADHGIEMVVIYQMTWSSGGDTIVMRNDDGSAPADLAGKQIGVQLYGPHMLYVATVLRDAGLSPADVKVRWLRELTIPPYDTKGAAVDPTSAMQRDPNLAAVAVISPDMLALTSGGNVGTGAESSVRGARLLLSTKTAGRIIADVYAVRKDYFDAQRDQVRSFVHGLLKSQEELLTLVAARQQRQGEYQEILRMSADLLRDSPQATTDIEGLLGDCTFVGLQENQQFFTGQGTLRSFEVLNREAQEALIGYGLLSRTIPLAAAGWNYGQLAAGLTQVGTASAEPRFNPAQVEQIARERELRGTTKQGVLFAFEILFEPNQTEFAASLYRPEFNRVLNLSATYPGAVIVIEGHSDPLKYLQDRQRGIALSILDQTKQAAKNLSVQRAIAVRESLISFGSSSQLALDSSQFTVVGAGIDRPKYGDPSTEQEWRANMRVDFQITQVEAELQQFLR
ncbi:MAG: ABC-type nitrate/sulfonate/bicarbonate transport system, periplasmic component [Chloroflexi bacterium]|nr:ABC-type nitrate/sulfonate/bicarbonate transport system, periplasmic component [Chloroflexota bacterium]